jgi:hypothetical protein
MRLFSCSRCANVVYFENNACESCGSRLGYHPARNVMYALEQDQEIWRAVNVEEPPFRLCANAEYDACNWLISADQDSGFCTACRHNEIIPDISIEANILQWRKMELAKHHLFYSLLRLRLPLENISFRFLADDMDGAPKVLTGHNDGTITLNLAEADDAIREHRRAQMREPYRTLLGHFRHEIGHYYWDRLVRDGGRLDAFRACFGDETRDYDEALKTYYAEGPPPDWQEHHVSAYATAHPWEDFAETWAHYLHITDTLEMARSCGIRISPVITRDPSLSAEIDFDPFYANDIDRLISRWHPVAIAVNNINRCMGQPDLYPFVLAPAIIAKLAFVHQLVHNPLRGEEVPERELEAQADG